MPAAITPGTEKAEAGESLEYRKQLGKNSKTLPQNKQQASKQTVALEVYTITL